MLKLTAKAILISFLFIFSIQTVFAAPPENFVNEKLIIGLNQPVAIDFAQDGRMFIVELGSRKILVVQPGALSPDATPFNTFPSGGVGEQGIHGFALDPDFLQNGFYYVFYTKNSRDVVSRFTASGNTTVSGSEKIVWQDNKDVGEWHHGGGIAFGNDGKIYISTGDQHDTNFTENHVSQRLDSYRGKILRLNKDGTVPLDNPFHDGEGPNLDAIWAIGLRNPFRIHINKQNGKLYIADVGGNINSTAYEELNLGIAGANYGWPICEGSSSCPVNITKPIFQYSHEGRDASITGGFVYTEGNFPNEYKNNYFYGDYAQNWLRRLKFDSTGNIVTQNLPFEPVDGSKDGPFGDIVDIKQGPDGALYYVDIAIDWGALGKKSEGSIRRIKYTSGNQPPVIHEIEANPAFGAGPEFTTTFTAEVSDEENDELTYNWDFGDGNSSNEISPQHTYTSKGAYTVRLKVTDSENNQTISDTLLVEVGFKPSVEILTPTQNSLFVANQQIHFKAQASDNDSTLNESNYSWVILFSHEDHVHPAFGPIEGATEGTFTIPKSGHSFNSNTAYEIIVTVTDEDGLQATDSVKIFPNKVNLEFKTVPNGLTLGIDQLIQEAPIEMSELKGFDITVTAPEQQYFNGKVYDFVSWSNGKSATHTLTVPNNDTTYIATYEEQTAAPKGSLFFDGEDDYVRTANLPLLNVYTYEVWFKTMGYTGKDQVIMSDGNWIYTQAMFTLALNSRTNICSGTYGEIVYSHTWEVQCTGVIAEPGKWYHIAITRDALKTRKIYVNGELKSTLANSGNSSDSNGLFSFGRAGNAAVSNFLGFIDEARISNKVMYTGNFSVPTTELQKNVNTVGLWHFNEGIGQQTKDESNNKYNGILGLIQLTDLNDPKWMSESPLTH